MRRIVYEDRYFEVVAPQFPLNSREDGGHLILIKKGPVSDRSDLLSRGNRFYADYHDCRSSHV